MNPPSVNKKSHPSRANKFIVITTLLMAIGLFTMCSEESSEISTPGKVNDGLLNEELEIIRVEYDVPSLGLVFVENGEIQEMGAVGFRANEFDEKVTTSDKWHLGSLTKSMTATMIARLVEKQILDWSLTIQEVFPEEFGRIHHTYRDVRLDELLYHVSGLHNDLVNVPSWEDIRNENGTEEELRLRWVIELMERNPSAKKGEFFYSNTGYIVAGAIAEKITSRSWRELMEEELFGPLGLGDTGFMSPGNPGERNQPWGHVLISDERFALDPADNGSDNPKAIGPAGVVHSTFSDYSKYMLEHLKGAMGQSDFLTKESFEKLHTPAMGTQSSLGWGSFTADGTRQLAHDGSNGFWYARVGLNLDDQNGYLFVTNLGQDEGLNAIDALQDWYNLRITNPR